MSKKQNDVAMPVRIPAELADKVRDISKRTGIPIATLVEQALQGKLPEYEEVAKTIEKIKN